MGSEHIEACLLATIPISGRYDEVFFGEGCSFSRVRFLTSGFEEWVGVFPRGASRSSFVRRVSDTPVFLVVSGGAGYFVHADTKQLQGVTADDDFQDAIWCEETKVFVGVNHDSFVVFDKQCRKFESSRVAMDGIKINGTDGRVVTASSDDSSGDPSSCSIDSSSFIVHAPPTIFPVS